MKKVSQYLKYDYYRYLLPYIKGKVVLDVGCVGHNINKANLTRLWSHWFVSKMAKEAIGIDIEKEELAKMRKMGFKVKKMNAEKISYKNKFDVVFAGELIEHLSNPGLFLRSATKALKSNGKIVITTLNTYSFAKFVRVVQFFTNEPPVNPDHTISLTPKLITVLAQKNGLKVTNIGYAHFPFAKEVFFVKSNKFMCKFLGVRFKEQIIAVIQKS